MVSGPVFDTLYTRHGELSTFTFCGRNDEYSEGEKRGHVANVPTMSPSGNGGVKT